MLKHDSIAYYMDKGKKRIKHNWFRRNMWQGGLVTVVGLSAIFGIKLGLMLSIPVMILWFVLSRKKPVLYNNPWYIRLMDKFVPGFWHYLGISKPMYYYGVKIPAHVRSDVDKNGNYVHERTMYDLLLEKVCHKTRPDHTLVVPYR